jgi:NADP-dependent aldehyde dehydrogenase
MRREQLMNSGPDTVRSIVDTATRASDVWGTTPRVARAGALRSVADALDANADQLIPIAMRETHLLEPRLRGEIARTTFQLRLLADEVERGSYLGVQVDEADPSWPMGAPRPDLRRTAVPLGPVLVFAASNFPFAFSVAGGDTASALAAGCPVIVKAHEGHPALSDATAALVSEALTAAGAPDGTFAMIRDPEAARETLLDDGVKAAAFTGSTGAGRALFDIAQSRREPIPFYGELGSVNPVFVSTTAAATRATEIVEGFVGSFTLGAGQFCTKPGVLLVPAASDLAQKLSETPLPEPTDLLNERISHGYRLGRDALLAHPGVTLINRAGKADQTAGVGVAEPTLVLTTVDVLMSDMDGLFAECFGPMALVVTYTDDSQLLNLAAKIEGQLTATIFAEPGDPVVPDLVTALTRRAGRVIWNQWPTGVSVTYAQHHGGPYPASTAPATTSVGTASIDRFVRPVALQGFPDQLLPEELRARRQS